MTLPNRSDNYLHYVKKADILRSTVEGTESTALCGECFVAYGLGTTGASGLAEVCPVCVSEYLSLPDAKAARKAEVA